MGRGDGAALIVELFAQRQADALLRLKADQRAIAVEGFGGAVNVAAVELAVDLDQDFGEAKAGHRAVGAIL